MNRTAIGWACWTVCAASLGALTACGGGISIGKDDGKLSSNGSGGAAAKAGSGGATTANPPTANPMHEPSGLAGGANVINAFPDAGTPGTSCLSNDEWVDWGGLNSAGCMSGPLSAPLRIRGIRVQNSFPGTGILIAGPNDQANACDLAGGAGTTTIARFGPGVAEMRFASDALLELDSGTRLTFGVQDFSGPQVGSASIKFLLAPADSTAQPVTLPELVPALDYAGVEPGAGATRTAHAAACNAPWMSLVSVAHQILQPGQEAVFGEYRKLTSDLDIGALRATPTASGAVVREITARFGPPSPDAGTEATLLGDLLPFPNLVGQFDGSSEVRYADGTAPHIPAGDNVVIEVHVLNTSAEPIEGTFLDVQYQPSAQ